MGNISQGIKINTKEKVLDMTLAISKMESEYVHLGHWLGNKTWYVKYNKS